VKNVEKLTRKVLFKKTSAGALAAGALAVVPAAAAVAATHPEAPAGADLAARLAELKTAEPFVVYVGEPNTGEMTLMVGHEQITVRDHALVARLWHARTAASRTAKSMGGK